MSAIAPVLASGYLSVSVGTLTVKADKWEQILPEEDDEFGGPVSRTSVTGNESCCEPRVPRSGSERVACPSTEGRNEVLPSAYGCEEAFGGVG